MSFELHNFGELPEATQNEIANRVSAYTNGQLNEQPQMLPISSNEIFEKQVVLVALQNEAFAGFIAATWPEEHGELTMPEVGTLWVPAEFRGQKIAHALADTISTGLFLAGQVPYAFCNSLSLPILTDVGYAVAKETAIPPTAFTACKNCPMKPENGCCDTPVLYNGGAS